MTKESQGFLLGAADSQCPFPSQHDLSLLIVSSQLCIFRAVIIAQLSTASTFFTLLSWLPTFFKETFPESKVGWLHSRGIAVQRSCAGNLPEGVGREEEDGRGIWWEQPGRQEQVGGFPVGLSSPGITAQTSGGLSRLQKFLVACLGMLKGAGKSRLYWVIDWCSSEEKMIFK